MSKSKSSAAAGCIYRSQRIGIQLDLTGCIQPRRCSISSLTGSVPTTMLDIFAGHTCQGPIQIWAVLLCQHVQNTWWITIDSVPSNLHSANFALVCAVGNRRCVVQIFNPSLPNPGKHGTLKTLANIPTFHFL